VLRDAGWSTFWIGKNHNVPVDAFDMGSSKKEWPLGLGFDRFYGFLGGETNQWFPELIEDNHFVTQPKTPEQGYHFSKDIADKAISFRFKAITAGEAVVHVVLSGCEPRASSRSKGVHREVQGQSRRRLRALS
jgi:arylsulfatase A-like enzyme